MAHALSQGACLPATWEAQTQGFSIYDWTFSEFWYQKGQVTWWSKVPSLFVHPRFCIHFVYPNLQLIYTSYSKDISLFLSLLIEDVEFTRTTATKLIGAKNFLFL